MLPDFPPLDLRSGVWARWAVWGRMTGGDVWSPALCPEARCDRMAQVKRGAIKEFNFVPRGGNWGFEKPRLEPSVSSV